MRWRLKLDRERVLLVSRSIGVLNVVECRVILFYFLLAPYQRTLLRIPHGKLLSSLIE